MFGLLSPGWLAGLVSLAVPLALHLWSRRGGRPIRVGSIRLLQGAEPATKRSWAIQDAPLLLVRTATLSALVLALAGPYWTPSPSVPAGRRWALVATEVAQPNALIDSLTRAGFDVHPLDGAPPLGLWAALREADRSAPRGTRFEVFAPDRLRYFRGERPAIAAALEWHVRPPRSHVTGAQPRAAIRPIAILADADRADDARYVAAALETAALATGMPAVVTIAPPAAVPPGDPTTPAGWIVWLSSRPVPSTVSERVRRGATLLTDAGGAPRADRRSRILLVGLASDAWLARGRIAADTGAPLWSDGTGRPLLTVAREGRGLHYRFHSRFDPGWNELVLRPSFPEAVAHLWLGADSASWPREDDRRIAMSQLLPARDSSPRRRSSPAALPPGGRSLFFPVWLLGLALFGTERWLARGGRPRRRAA